MTDLLARHHDAFGKGAPLFYDDPVEVVSGNGVWIDAADGRRYLDLYNNVPCVGHANPRVAAAVAEQVATLNVHSRYLHEGVLAYVERLLGLHHDGIESMIVACTGTEANDVAISTARIATGKTGVIGTDGTYHGNSPIVGSMTRLPAGEARGGFRSIPTPQRFRPPAPGMSDAELLDHHLAALAATIEAMEVEGEGVAALLLCSILANEGLPEPPEGWFEQATAMVRAAGGLIIADEVQSGFGRSGRWWGYETSGFVPDIVTMGKPMGNGVPVAAVAASRDLIERFRERSRYFNTFAASPLQAAAGMAVIDEIVDRGLVEQVAEVGSSMRGSLRELAAEHPAMGDVRGHGLFLGIDWVEPGTTEPDVDGAARVVEAMKAHGMLMGKAGQFGNVLKIRPPIVFEHEHADLMIEAFTEAVVEAGG